MMKFLILCAAIMGMVLRVYTSKTMVICENKSNSVSCPAGHLIKIASANYGRTSKGTCRSSSDRDTNCKASKSLSIVKSICDGNNACSLEATNGVFGDPCVGTYKYLTVVYNCYKSDEKSLVICEHKSDSLSCPDDKKLEIVSANYGRTAPSSKGTCPTSVDKNTNCRASKSLSIVQSQCEGKSTCSLKASNGVFGDPCVGTYKYLRVVYKCSSVASKTMVICEHKSNSVSCPAGHLIKIASANYGRTSKGTCRTSSDRDTNCKASKSLSIVKSICDGNNACSLEATNGVFGDPCVGTYKYLTVVYNCYKSDEKSLVICEHKSDSLSCPDGKKLEIVSANYGRTAPSSKGTCPTSVDKNTNCRASKSLSIVQSQCEGKSTCSLKASNGVFGDPCVGTYKYLRVVYKCSSVGCDDDPAVIA